MRNEGVISKGIDWTMIWLYIILLTIGLLCIYSVEQRSNEAILQNITGLKKNYARQLLFIGISAVVAIFILLTDSKFFTATANISYVFGIALMMLTFVVGKNINGSKSWIPLGFFNLQPVETCKIFTGLALAKFLSRTETDPQSHRDDQPSHPAQELLHAHEHPDRGSRAPGRHVSIRSRPRDVSARRELQGARTRQPLRRGHEFLPQHRGREPGTHRDGQRDARGCTPHRTVGLGPGYRWRGRGDGDEDRHRRDDPNDWEPSQVQICIIARFFISSYSSAVILPSSRSFESFATSSAGEYPDTRISAACIRSISSLSCSVILGRAIM